jgi:hypothetical protein
MLPEPLRKAARAVHPEYLQKEKDKKPVFAYSLPEATAEKVSSAAEGEPTAAHDAKDELERKKELARRRLAREKLLEGRDKG